MTCTTLWLQPFGPVIIMRPCLPFMPAAQPSKLVMQVAELLMGVPAPILYWEQGHEWLFGDPVRFQASPLQPAYARHSEKLCN